MGCPCRRIQARRGRRTSCCFDTLRLHRLRLPLPCPQHPHRRTLVGYGLAAARGASGGTPVAAAGAAGGWGAWALRPCWAVLQGPWAGAHLCRPWPFVPAPVPPAPCPHGAASAATLAVPPSAAGPDRAWTWLAFAPSAPSASAASSPPGAAIAQGGPSSCPCPRGRPPSACPRTAAGGG